MQKERVETIRDNLARSKGWPVARRIIEALERMPPGEPLSTIEICRIAQCDGRKAYQYMSLVKRYFEMVEGKKVANAVNVGYWLATTEMDKLLEGGKEGSRSTGHGRRQSQTLSLVDPSRFTTRAEFEMFADQMAMNKLHQSIQALQQEMSGRIKDEETRRRMSKIAEHIRSETEISKPVLYLIGAENPSATIAKAIDEVDREYDDE